MMPRRLLILAALAVGAACATEEPAPAPASAPAAMRRVPHTDVRTLIGDAACQSDAQCSTIGIGAKACGGPAAYLAWSSWRTDGQKLHAAAERQAEAQRQSQIASGRASNCMVETDPGAYCAFSAGSSTGTCRLRGGRIDGLPRVAQ